MSAPLHMVVESLRVYDSDGNPKSGELSGKVRLEAGPGMRFSEEGGSVSVSLDPTNIVHDADALIKYNQIVEGGGAFSGAPHYVSSLSGLSPRDGNVFLLGGDTSQVGLFEDGEHPGGDPGSAVRGESLTSHGLHLFDMGLPEVDCDDFQKVFDNMRLIRDFLEEARVRITDDPQSDPEQYGVIRQLEALLRYWHFMAAQLCVFLAVRPVTSEAESYLAVNASYVNMSKTSVPAGLRAIMVVDGPRGVFSKESSNQGAPAHTVEEMSSTRLEFTFTERLGVGERVQLRFKYKFSALEIEEGAQASVTSRWENTHVSTSLETTRKAVLERWSNPVGDVDEYEEGIPRADV